MADAQDWIISLSGFSRGVVSGVIGFSMDRALMERMVGAVVLVLLFVVFVPALLDGPDEVTEAPAELSAGNNNRTAVIVLNEVDEPEVEAPEPVVVQPAPEPQTESPVSQPEPAAQPAKVEAAAKAKELPPKPAARKKQAPNEGFAVQLGSFSSRDNATSFAGSIRDAGYPVFVIHGRSGSASVYRVYVGPESTRPDAEKVAARLKASGQSVMVVDLSGLANG